MSLSPNDVRSFEFSGQMRGYDKEEVDNFLEQVAQVLEATKQENVQLSMELDTLRAQNTSFKQNEDIIKGAAIDARRNADLTIGQAKSEAQQILLKAKEEAEILVSDKVKKIQEIEHQIKRIEQNRKNYLGKLRTLVSSHLDLVEKESEAEVREVLASPGDITVTESEDVTSEKREIIAEIPEDERTEVPDELRSTVQEDEPELSEEPARDALDVKVEEGDTELADALRKYKQVKEAHPPYIRDEDDDKDIPEPIPSLASPNKKWVETTTRAEEPPPEFIAMKAENKVKEDPAPADKGSMEPNPIPADDDESDTDRNVRAQRSGKVDVEKEFDEIAAKFNEEMDKAENRDK